MTKEEVRKIAQQEVTNGFWQIAAATFIAIALYGLGMGLGLLP